MKDGELGEGKVEGRVNKLNSETLVFRFAEIGGLDEEEDRLEMKVGEWEEEKKEGRANKLYYCL